MNLWILLHANTYFYCEYFFRMFFSVFFSTIKFSELFIHSFGMKQLCGPTKLEQCKWNEKRSEKRATGKRYNSQLDTQKHTRIQEKVLTTVFFKYFFCFIFFGILFMQSTGTNLYIGEYIFIKFTLNTQHSATKWSDNTSRLR